MGLNEIIQTVEIGTYPPASITELNGHSNRKIIFLNGGCSSKTRLITGW